MNRQFLLLAHDYNPKKHHIAGWMVSEKHDGSRALWDGGVTRGLAAEEVPWWNDKKKGHRIAKIYATGLWSRYGNVIHAPDEFLNNLPDFPLDGELWIDRGKFQLVRSIVSEYTPSSRWSQVRYRVIDTPLMSMVLRDGVVNLPQYQKNFHGFYDWYDQRVKVQAPGPFTSFEYAYKFLKKNLPAGMLIEQIQLPFGTGAALTRLEEEYNGIIEQGGEGVILRKPISMWVPERSWQCLKMKPLLDGEGVVTGYVSGRETDKGSKLLGLMGALILDYKGKRFELSGFTEAERRMNSSEAFEWGTRNPGKEFPPDYHNELFPIGSVITFQYRELTDAGLPKEGKYHRVRATTMETLQ